MSYIQKDSKLLIVAVNTEVDQSKVMKFLRTYNNLKPRWVREFVSEHDLETESFEDLYQNKYCHLLRKQTNDFLFDKPLHKSISEATFFFVSIDKCLNGEKDGIRMYNKYVSDDADIVEIVNTFNKGLHTKNIGNLVKIVTYDKGRGSIEAIYTEATRRQIPLTNLEADVGKWDGYRRDQNVMIDIMYGGFAGREYYPFHDLVNDICDDPPNLSSTISQALCIAEIYMKGLRVKEPLMTEPLMNFILANMQQLVKDKSKSLQEEEDIR